MFCNTIQKGKGGFYVGFNSQLTQSFNPDILILQYESVQLVHVCLPSEQKQEQFWLRKEWKNGCVSLSKNQLFS